METPDGFHPPSVPEQNRAPLRLRMAPALGENRLDGGWWPQSRDLTVELADLVGHLAAGHGRIVQALVSPPDWDPGPRRIAVGSGYLEVGSLPSDDVHLVQLTTADGAVLRILVVPPDFTGSQGAESLLAAATSGNAHSAADLLREATEYAEVDPDDVWNDEGGAWWGSDPTAPSFRTDA